MVLRPHVLQPGRLLWPSDFPGQEYWSGLPFPSPGDLPDPGIEPSSPELQTDSSLSYQGIPLYMYIMILIEEVVKFTYSTEAK